MNEANHTVTDGRFRINSRIAGGLVFVLLVAAVLAVKARQEGWFVPEPPLDLPNQPVLLLFNRYRGCECALDVYEAAEWQVRGWPEEARLSVPVLVINLDRQKELGERYKVHRAPSLMLLDAAGNVVYRQNEVVTDDLPLDLETFEQKIREMQKP
jgi:hypothetical protein